MKFQSPSLIHPEPSEQLSFAKFFKMVVRIGLFSHSDLSTATTTKIKEKQEHLKNSGLGERMLAGFLGSSMGLESEFLFSNSLVT